MTRPEPVKGDGFTIRAAEAPDSYVMVGDHLVPAWLEIELDGDSSGPATFARVEVRDGAPRIVDLRFHARAEEGEVRQTHLRAVELDALIELFAAHAVKVTEDPPRVILAVSDEGAVDPDVIQLLRRLRSNRKITRTFLEEVAAVYRENLTTGPTKAVRERYFVSERMASNYVQRARAAGLLPPTSAGKKKG